MAAALNKGTTLPSRSKNSETSGGTGVVSELGQPLKTMFLMADGYKNMNNGSFGTIPRVIQQKLRDYQDQAEARPDPFIRYDYGCLLDKSRVAISQLVNAPLNGTVFVSNATTGVNAVLRGLAGDWNAQQRQPDAQINEILYFNTIYGGCGKSVDYIADTSGGAIRGRELNLTYPCEDEDVVTVLREGVKQSRSEGANPRVAIFDIVSSLPGVYVPWPRLVQVCREEGMFSLVDGAQGVGMVSIDVAAADPDFFVSNCHKWLHVPRGCAVFYVAERNQALIPSSLPTSHGYMPRASSKRLNPLPADETKSKWVKNFEFVGTIDNAPYLCVKDSIAWREDILGGETTILKYLQNLAKIGGKKAASILGTEILDNATGTLSNCAMVNVALPIVVKGADYEWLRDRSESLEKSALVVLEDATEAGKVITWFLKTLIHKYDTFVALYLYRNRLWSRISAQVFLDLADFEWTGNVLKEVCETVSKGEWKR